MLGDSHRADRSYEDVEVIRAYPLDVFKIGWLAVRDNVGLEKLPVPLKLDRGVVTLEPVKMDFDNAFERIQKGDVFPPTTYDLILMEVHENCFKKDAYHLDWLNTLLGGSC